MKESEKTVIKIEELVRRFGETDAVDGLSMEVGRGRCYGLFGRNGAGKTTTIKCLLNLLHPTSGRVQVFGMDPKRDEVAVKSRLAYVPDEIAFYPWMTVADFFEYLASFRDHWSQEKQRRLLEQFELDPGKRTSVLSRGEKTQVALIGAICPEPELLILDEPTSGLDPYIRREVAKTVIGAYQEDDPENRTILVSTHLIAEFEGLIDEFTVMERGKEVLTLESDQARQEFKKVRASFDQAPALNGFRGVVSKRQLADEIEWTIRGDTTELTDALSRHDPKSLEVEALSLEEVFLSTLHQRGRET